mgnify:FL=1
MKVAVITPTIGNQKLSDCLKSVDNQTYKNLTHYIFSDGVENFDRVVVTRYPKHENLIVHKSTLVVQETWDERLIDRVDRTTTPCFRPLLEFTIVAGGDVVICCQDWKNEIKLGNVLDDKLSDIVARKAKLLESIVRSMTDETPERCRSCNGKLGIPAHMEIAERPLKFLKDRDIKTRLTGNFYLPDS